MASRVPPPSQNAGSSTTDRKSTGTRSSRPGQGCTGDLNLLGDFAVVADVVISDNYLGANPGSSFCFYGGDAASKPFPHANNVVVTDNTYGGTYRYFERILRKYGLDFTYVDTSNLDAIAGAFKATTKLLFVETPTNPVLALTDLAADQAE